MFKQLLPDYQTFRDTAQELGVTENALDYFFFQRLMREYANIETAYENPYDFYGQFFNIYEDAYIEVAKRKELADVLYTLQEADYTKDYNITTFAQNPNETPLGPSELLNYFNTQNYSEANMKRVEAYARAFQLVPRYVIKEFVGKFKRLFLACIPSQDYLY